MKNPKSVAAGSVGGRRRAESLSAERRRKIALAAAAARWAGHVKGDNVSPVRAIQTLRRACKKKAGGQFYLRTLDRLEEFFGGGGDG
jgi:hypothetical protein